MNLIGHEEFGLNSKPFIYPNNINCYTKKNKMTLDYWLIQWINTYTWILEDVISKNKNVYLVSYEDLCKKQNTYKKICEIINVKNNLISTPFSLSKRTIHKKNQLINEQYIKIAKDLYNKLLLLTVN